MCLVEYRVCTRDNVATLMEDVKLNTNNSQMYDIQKIKIGLWNRFLEAIRHG